MGSAARNLDLDGHWVVVLDATGCGAGGERESGQSTGCLDGVRGGVGDGVGAARRSRGPAWRSGRCGRGSAGSVGWYRRRGWRYHRRLAGRRRRRGRCCDGDGSGAGAEVGVVVVRSAPARYGVAGGVAADRRPGRWSRKPPADPAGWRSAGRLAGMVGWLGVTTCTRGAGAPDARGEGVIGPCVTRRQRHEDRDQDQSESCRVQGSHSPCERETRPAPVSAGRARGFLAHVNGCPLSATRLGLRSVLRRARVVAGAAECTVERELVGAVIAARDVAAGDVHRDVGIDRRLVGVGARGRQLASERLLVAQLCLTSAAAAAGSWSRRSGFGCCPGWCRRCCPRSWLLR